ncbi:flagellar motor protein MotB [Brevibacillus dissolubilis]|uniref:flagellar motor protein MotB n=1 Tax=Brevibacillus dissolubilis TaxID=1844116 RepID=UPI001115C167|nr:flagellar motor protein MotB [Brevibacillus dissolubilis]
MAKHKKHHHEEHIDETWLIPYADLLTLLLALFIVLFASSSVDAKKFNQLVRSLNVALNGGTSIFQNPSALPIPEEVAQQSLERNQAEESEEKKDKKKFEQAEKFQQETEQLGELKEQLDKYIANNNLKDKLQTKITDMGLLITITDSALFDSGSALVRPEARKLAGEISKLLVPDARRVTVSGHTDNVPIRTSQFPSNWDLSSERALNFMKILLENKSLNPSNFSATGYGEYQPIAPNTTLQGRAKNRRVEVAILRNYEKADGQ